MCIVPALYIKVLWLSQGYQLQLERERAKKEREREGGREREREGERERERGERVREIDAPPLCSVFVGHSQAVPIRFPDAH